jgi:hypothetical protein
MRLDLVRIHASLATLSRAARFSKRERRITTATTLSRSYIASAGMPLRHCTPFGEVKKPRVNRDPPFLLECSSTQHFSQIYLSRSVNFRHNLLLGKRYPRAELPADATTTILMGNTLLGRVEELEAVLVDPESFDF